MLLTEDKLVAQLKRHLSKAKRVDIAMAWISPCEALLAIQVFADRKPGCLRSIVGITGNATHPQALRLLQKKGNYILDYLAVQGPFSRGFGGVRAVDSTGSTHQPSVAG